MASGRTGPAGSRRVFRFGSSRVSSVSCLGKWLTEFSGTPENIDAMDSHIWLPTGRGLRTTMEETILEWQPPKIHRYRLDGFIPPKPNTLLRQIAFVLLRQIFIIFDFGGTIPPKLNTKVIQRRRIAFGFAGAPFALISKQTSGYSAKENKA